MNRLTEAWLTPMGKGNRGGRMKKRPGSELGARKSLAAPSSQALADQESAGLASHCGTALLYGVRGRRQAHVARKSPGPHERPGLPLNGIRAIALPPNRSPAPAVKRKSPGPLEVSGPGSRAGGACCHPKASSTLNTSQIGGSVSQKRRPGAGKSPGLIRRPGPLGLDCAIQLGAGLYRGTAGASTVTRRRCGGGRGRRSKTPPPVGPGPAARLLGTSVSTGAIQV
jgi:hypothetical protein